MIFRAIFWVGLVALLMPHQPDIGLGRPGAGTAHSVSAASPATTRSVHAATGIARVDEACDGNREACAGSLAFLDNFQDAAVKGLQNVRTDIENYRKTHKDRVMQARDQKGEKS